MTKIEIDDALDKISASLESCPICKGKAENRLLICVARLFGVQFHTVQCSMWFVPADSGCVSFRYSVSCNSSGPYGRHTHFLSSTESHSSRRAP